VAMGVGACSSYESKFRYRVEWWNQDGDPPAGQGWERTRRGAWKRRSENPDLVDACNTVIKMAKKRALVDAALTISGASEKFTQDLEDMDLDTTTQPAPRGNGKAQGKPAPQIIPKPWSEWSEKARDAFWAKAEAIGLTKEATLAEFNVTDMAEYQGGQNRAATLLHILAAAFERGLDLEQVHEALAVQVIEDWQGTKDGAVAQIDMWLAGQQETAA